MLFSMFSPEKNEDKHLLLTLSEVIEVLARINKPTAQELIQKFGQDYLELEQKIQTHDYSNEDKLWDKLKT